YMAAKGLKDGDVHPVYKALNTLDYAVGNLGNHEFNYGLDYLHTAVRCISYKDSKAVHRGIIIGTIVVAILMFGMHLAGALGRA
ncbi:hypothetical protein ONQ62_28805, partial [Salmonella enterica subsp. enterica serovar Virginia]|nr:hypothetical protein [Salmonella enterica subsp. enterica serovar Virginia]